MVLHYGQRCRQEFMVILKYTQTAREIDLQVYMGQNTRI